MCLTDTNTDRAYDITTAGVGLSSFAAAGTPFGVAIVPSSVTPEPSFGPLLLVGVSVSVSFEIAPAKSTQCGTFPVKCEDPCLGDLSIRPLLFGMYNECPSEDRNVS